MSNVEVSVISVTPIDTAIMVTAGCWYALFILGYIGLLLGHKAYPKGALETILISALESAVFATFLTCLVGWLPWLLLYKSIKE